MKNRYAYILISALCLGLMGCGESYAPETGAVQEAPAEKKTEETTEAAQEKTDAAAAEQTSAEPVEAATTESTEESVSVEDEIALLTSTLEKETGAKEEDIQVFEAKDFDEDGNLEAFAIVGSDAEDYDDRDLVEGNVYFVNKDGVQKLIDRFGMGLEKKCEVLDFGTKNYVVFNDVYATGVMSYVYEVAGKAVSEAAVSTRGQLVKMAESNAFRLIDSSYDMQFDPALGSTLGHTWKSYYFYFDQAANSLKEYGAIEITEDKAKELVGEDIVAKCLSEGDKLENILYRKNGILHINYSNTDSEGYINYMHRNYDMAKKCFIDDFSAEKSDEIQLGTYLPALCPDIAEYPDK